MHLHGSSSASFPPSRPLARQQHLSQQRLQTSWIGSARVAVWLWRLFANSDGMGRSNKAHQTRTNGIQPAVGWPRALVSSVSATSPFSVGGIRRSREARVRPASYDRVRAPERSLALSASLYGARADVRDTADPLVGRWCFAFASEVTDGLLRVPSFRAVAAVPTRQTTRGVRGDTV